MKPDRSGRSPGAVLRRIRGLRRTEVATFAAGCFWGVEAELRQLDGVIDTVTGYSGGFTPDPTYEQVRAGQTGHAEAVRVTFAPGRMSYEALLDAFWQIHDPTQVGHQGFDIGDQYRAVVFTHTPEQTRLALSSRAREQRSRARPIATEVREAGPFYAAEPHHQRFYERDGGVTSGSHALTNLESWQLALAEPDDASPQSPGRREAESAPRR